MASYRGAGFTPDDFSHVRKAREAAANALTKAEDARELAGGRQVELGAIRALRRRLELELFP